MIKYVSIQDIFRQQKKLFEMDSAEFHRALMITIIRDVYSCDDDKLFKVVIEDFKEMINEFKKNPFL